MYGSKTNGILNHIITSRYTVIFCLFVHLIKANDNGCLTMFQLCLYVCL